MAEYIEREAAIKLFNFAVLDCLGMEPTIRAGDIIKALESIPAADVRPVEWIPVTERLPDMDVEVLVCTEDYGETELGFAMVAVFDGTGWLETWERKTYLTAVTHWIPLPQPPKEE